MEKKYKDMTYKEFLTEVLKIEFTEEQLQLLDMFAELKEDNVKLIINPYSKPTESKPYPSTVPYPEPYTGPFTRTYPPKGIDISSSSISSVKI